MPGQPIAQGGPDERHKIERDDLLSIMYGSIENDVDVIFGRSIIRLDESRDSVMAWFDDRSRQAFSPVFGCDGRWSNTRRLVFGSDFLIKVIGKSYIRSDLARSIAFPERR